MKKELIAENAETRMQFVLDENSELQEIPKDKCKPVEYLIKYKLKNAFEVFVRVEDTENYWISNYGRCVNNLNRKDKNTFYEHKEGKRHYTIFEIEREIMSYPIKSKCKTKIPNKKKEKTERVFRIGTPFEECNRILEEKKMENEKRIFSLRETRWRKETTPENLVADTFLVKS